MSLIRNNIPKIGTKKVPEGSKYNQLDQLILETLLSKLETQ